MPYPPGMRCPIPTTPLAFATLAALSALVPPVAAQRIDDGIITWPDGFTMEVGEPGLLPPAATGGPARLVHDDTTGGVPQTLVELVAGGGGFSAVWTDQRDGNLGLFLGHLRGDGRVVDGAPIHLPRSSRQVLPRVALVPGAAGDDRSGLVAWLAAEMGGDLLMLRRFGPGGQPEVERGGAEALLGEPTPLAGLAGVGPRVALGPDGVGAVTWLAGTTLEAQVLLPDAASGELRPGPRRTLLTGFAPTEGAYELALGPGGRGLVTWTAPGQAAEGQPAPPMLHVLPVDLKGREPVAVVDPATLLAPDGGAGGDAAGAGEPGSDQTPADRARPAGLPRHHGVARPLGLALGPTGFWLLADRGKDLVLERLDATGAATAPAVPVAAGGVADARLATWAEGRGLAVLVERRVVRTDATLRASAVGDVRLVVLTPDGRRLTPQGGAPALDAGAVEARNPRLAALGQHLVVAWNDEREDKGDVWYRLLGPTDLQAPARRWNLDEASSDQAHAAVASDGDRRARVAWEDERDGTAQIWSRALTPGADGTLEVGPEAPVDGTEGARAAFPALAVGADGGSLVTWKERLDRSWILRGRALAADGSPRGPARDLDPGHVTAHAWPASVVALDGGAGYAVLWVRPDEGPVLQRIAPDGRPVGRPRLLVPHALGADADPRNPDLERLDDGRLVAAWDQLAALRLPGDPPAAATATRRLCFGLVVDLRGQDELVPFVLGRSPSGGDHDPALAATPGGGFLVAWTGNDGPVRDVLAQAFGAGGRPADPMLAISVKANEQDFADAVRLPDGRVLVAWEDDISGRDHGFARALDTRAPSARRYIDNQRPPRGELFPAQLLNDVATDYVEDRHAPRLAPLAGGYVAVWDDLARGKGHDVVARWFPLP